MGATTSFSGKTIEEILEKMKQGVKQAYPGMQPDGKASVHNKQTDECHLYEVVITDAQMVTGACPKCKATLTIDNHQHLDPNKPAMCPNCSSLVNPDPLPLSPDVTVELREISLDTSVNSATRCGIAVHRIYHREETDAGPWEGCIHFS